MQFVAGDTGQINTELRDVHRDLARGLHRVGVQIDTLAIGGVRVGEDLRDLGQRLHGAGFVVRQHHADESRLGAQGTAYIVRRDQAALVHRKERDVATEFLEPMAGLQHRFVLDRAGDHVVAGLHQTWFH